MHEWIRFNKVTSWIACCCALCIHASFYSNQHPPLYCLTDNECVLCNVNVIFYIENANSFAWCRFSIFQHCVSDYREKHFCQLLLLPVKSSWKFSIFSISLSSMVYAADERYIVPTIWIFNVFLPFKHRSDMNRTINLKFSIDMIHS